jgi:PEP-CTERM motif-containing protein
VRHTFQLMACVTAVWLAVPPTATAEPINITSGVITLPGLFSAASTTLAGTDGTRAFTFNGVISSDANFSVFFCNPCTSQIGVNFISSAAAVGNVNYGSENYQTGAGFLDTQGALVLNVVGSVISLPAPGALGETRSFSVPFTASGLLIPPFDPGGLRNTLSGSGMVTVSVGAGPGNEQFPLVWDFQRAEYQFTQESGGPAPVPEPASFLLFASGLSAFVLKRRSQSL